MDSPDSDFPPVFADLADVWSKSHSKIILLENEDQLRCFLITEPVFGYMFNSPEMLCEQIWIFNDQNNEQAVNKPTSWVLL